MSFLENPNVKRVLMIVVALAVVAVVAYVIYHFTAGPGADHGSDSTSTTGVAGTTTTGAPSTTTTKQGFEDIPAEEQEAFDTMSPMVRQEGFTGCSARQMVQEGFEDPMPAEGQQESVAKPVAADNTLGMNQMPSECYPKDVLSSVDLLPSDANSHYAMVNPNGQGALSDQNFLTAGYHIGINTVGQTLRNANRQLRSDPPCPQVPVSPWNNTTIEYDGNRRPLEIGGAP
jgi:hypothetical protein